MARTELPALRGLDGEDTFTYVSIFRRLPDIIRSVLESVHCDSETIDGMKAILKDIENNEKITPLGWDPLGFNKFLCEASWLSAPWWFIEHYFYRRIDACFGYVLDPFHAIKMQALDAAVADLAKYADDNPQTLTSRIYHSLWGNRADLSLSGGKVGVDSSAKGVSPAALLCDDCSAVVEYITSFKPSANHEVIFVLDNVGLELISDLRLVDHLFTHFSVSRIVLHAKPAPVFVSDVMPKDLNHTLERLAREPSVDWLHALSRRLGGYMLSGKLRVAEHCFYVSPLPMWDAPADIMNAYSRASLVLVKGDANYRRLLGDRHWPMETTFTSAVSYFPSPLIALRTLKSEIAVGLSDRRVAHARAAHPDDWLVSGQYGVLQFKP